jgi:prefoldin subunit 5
VWAGGPRGSPGRIRNPLTIPTAAVEALVSLGELASRLPAALLEVDQRVQRLMEDISAMRAAVEPLDGRMEQLEAEMRAMHRSLSAGMDATNSGMKETANLQQVTNEGIGELVNGVQPLGGGIIKVERNTSSLPDQIGGLQQLMSTMLEQFSSLHEVLEPVSSAAEPVARLREKLPGNSS